MLLDRNLESGGMRVRVRIEAMDHETRHKFLACDEDARVMIEGIVNKILKNMNAFNLLLKEGHDDAHACV